MNCCFSWVGPAALLVNLLVAVPISRWGPRRENRRGSLIFGIIALAGLAAAVFSLER
jgi:lipopolysaccharide export LptBFGC system permease protein LptF